MSREFKHYQLRSVPKPFKHDLLMSEVAITGKDGQSYYCYVAFSDTLVRKIGGYIPLGLLPGTKTFLRVDWNILGENWDISAAHVSGNSLLVEGIHLWSTKDENPPTWLKFIKAKVKRNEAGTPKKARPNASANTRRAASAASADTSSPKAAATSEAQERVKRGSKSKARTGLRKEAGE